MMMNEPKKFYSNQIALHNKTLQKLKKQLTYSSIVRLSVFIAIIACVYFGYPNAQVIIGSILFGITAFLLLVSRHENLTHKKNKIQELIKINTLELAVLNGDRSNLETGSAYTNPIHFYSNDIDLFGDNSFYQYINRTSTKAGKDNLANILSANSIDTISQKQEAIENLSKSPEWRQEFRAIASLVNVSVSIDSIQKWFQNHIPFVPKIMKTLPTIIAVISSIFVVLLFAEIITFKLFLMWFFVGLAITGTQLKKINKLYTNANQVKDTFEQYYKLVSLLENITFTSSLLKEKQQLIIDEKEKASVILKQFAGILNAFDQRNNMLFGVLANGLLLWDIKQSYRIEKWIKNNHVKVSQWFEVIAFFDAYNSLGNFAYNHPKYIFPKITSNNVILKANGLGHPMLDATKRVDNDIKIDDQQFIIITGANMAGKSTFLRTIALQIVMSNIGLPICAKTCEYKPIKLISSMRTSDSLSDDASYFFSELVQLKKIVTALEKDDYFIILDEILKGTNSKDKATGSRKFVERLIKANATGIIATHDLSLCEIANDIPQVKNHFFDAKILNDELHFDYTFKQGICQNMNASFLLEKMGIV